MLGRWSGPGFSPTVLSDLSANVELAKEIPYIIHWFRNWLLNIIVAFENRWPKRTSLTCRKARHNAIIG